MYVSTVFRDMPSCLLIKRFPFPWLYNLIICLTFIISVLLFAMTCCLLVIYNTNVQLRQSSERIRRFVEELVAQFAPEYLAQLAPFLVAQYGPEKVALFN